MADMNRRDFLAAAAALTCACALCPSMAHAADDDDDDAAKAAVIPAEKVDIGPLTDFSKDGGVDKWNKDHNILIVREKGKLFALTAVCPHKKFLVKLGDNGQFVCPKHGSRFTLDGDLAPKASGKMGPAKKPLVHYGISVNADGHVIVDTAKTFDKDKWDNDGAFVKAEK